MSAEKMLAVSPAPHINARKNTASIMRDVLIALIPAQAWAVYIFGPSCLMVTALSIAFCVIFEWGCRRALRKPQAIGDLSAAVTGAILAMGLPPSTPWWMIMTGAFAAIVVTKQIFGGLGRNFANPALVGRAVLFYSYQSEMQRFIVTSRMSRITIAAAGGPAALMGADAVSGATPLALFSNARSLPSNLEMFLGLVNGSMGEISALALILGGVYLCARKVISPVIPLSYALTVMAAAKAMGFDPIFHVCAGGVMLAAVFMATDPVTSPVLKSGKLIYGIGCGFLTMYLRTYTSYPEGITSAMLLMNVLTPQIDRLTVGLRLKRAAGREKSDG